MGKILSNDQNQSQEPSYCQNFADVLASKMDKKIDFRQMNMDKLDGWMDSIVGIMQAQCNRLLGSQINKIKSLEIGREIRNQLQDEFTRIIDWLKYSEDKTTMYLTNHFIALAKITEENLNSNSKIEVIAAYNYNLENDFPTIIGLLNASQKGEGKGYQEFIKQLRFLSYMHVQRRLTRQSIWE